MKKFKVLLSGLMVFVMLVVSGALNTLALTPQKTDKQAFAEYCDSIVRNNALLQTAQNKTENFDDVYEAALKFVSNDIAAVREILQNDTYSPTKTLAADDVNVTYEEFEEYLNSKGVFIYSTEEIPVVTPFSSGSTDVTMNKVIVMYNSATNQWSVTGGGYWQDHGYGADMPLELFPYVGKRINIGGQDAVGVTLYQVSGPKPTLMKCSGYVHDGYGKNMTLNNPYNLDSTRGVAFEFQDYKTITKVNFLDHNYTYMGYGFSAQAIYNSKFAEYNGKARTYYAHTWKNTNINSIGVSTTGFSTSWSDSNYRWAVYNNSETVF